MALNSAGCFDGQSAPWTETPSPQLDLWGPVPPHKPRENTGKARRLPVSFVKDAFKAWGEKIHQAKSTAKTGSRVLRRLQ